MTKKKTKLTPEEIKDIEAELEGLDLEKTMEVLKDLEEVLLNMTIDLDEALEPECPEFYPVMGNHTVH